MPMPMPMNSTLLLLFLLPLSLLVTTSSSSLLRSKQARIASWVHDNAILLESTSIEQPLSSPLSSTTLQNTIRDKFHKQAGSIHTVLMTRTPGRPIKLGMHLREDSLDHEMQIKSIESGSSADLAGLLEGDVIQRPSSAADLKLIVSKASVGNTGKVNFLIERNNEQLSVNVTVMSDITDFGLALTMTSRFDGLQNCQVFQVANVKKDSIAAKASPNLMVGDVVLAVNGIPAPSNRDMVERLLMSSAHVVLTIFNGDSFKCPSTTIATHKKSISLTDHQLRNVLDTLTPTDIHNRLDVVTKELAKLQQASHSCVGSKACTTGHIERIQQALREETQGCIRAQSMYDLFYSDACEKNATTSKCAAAKQRTDAAIANQCDPTQRKATCATILTAWSDYYKRRCKLMANATKCNQEKLQNELRISDTCVGPIKLHGPELDCGSIKVQCSTTKSQLNNQSDYSQSKLCGSDGKTYDFPCDLAVQSCINMQHAIDLGKDPLQYALDKVHSGPCQGCRQITLSKNALFQVKGYGMDLKEWTSDGGQSFPQITQINSDSVAANSGHIFPNDIIVMMDSQSTCNRWTGATIMSTFKETSSIGLTVCLPNAVPTVASKICPKATLSKCSRVRIGKEVLIASIEVTEDDGNKNHTLPNRLIVHPHQGKCGGTFPMVNSNTFPTGAVGSLLVPGSVLFSLGGLMQCNQNKKSFLEQINAMKKESNNKEGDYVLIDVCPKEAVETHLVCNFICKQLPPAPPIINEEKPIVPAAIPNELVVFPDKNQNNNTHANCRRIKFLKSKLKYGIEITEIYLNSVRRYVITAVHEGRGLDHVDIQINDTLSIVHGIDVDDIPSVHHLEDIMEATKSSVEVWVTRKNINHDLKRILNRDPIGFGLTLNVEGSKLNRLPSCPSVTFPSIAEIDTLLYGLILVDAFTNEPVQLVHANDYIVRRGENELMCNQKIAPFQNILATFPSVVLEICPQSTIHTVEPLLCNQCNPLPPLPAPSPAVTPVSPSPSPEARSPSPEAPLPLPNPSPLPIPSPSELCIKDGEHKWCPREFLPDCPPMKACEIGRCVHLLETCPILGPCQNTCELEAWCKKFPNDETCTRPVPVPDPVDPDPGPDPVPPAPAPAPERPPPPPPCIGCECRPGAYCPYGICPNLYIKTLDGYCAPGKNAPRMIPIDPNHICLPGQWCPPQYSCPPGFELKYSGKDGFCFDKTRMGPFTPHKYIGADFDAFSTVPLKVPSKDDEFGTRGTAAATGAAAATGTAAATGMAAATGVAAATGTAAALTPVE